MARNTKLTGMTIPLRDPNRNKRRLPLFIAAALVLAAVFISLFRDMGVVDSWRLRKTERQLRSEVEKLRQENALLKRTVEDLRGNPAVIEQEARRVAAKILYRALEQRVLLSKLFDLDRKSVV